ncbi:ectoine hydroxylase [Polycladomyces abyssicola]|uniref:Ectoine hydroxylase n=1 Tax=Polycladomyces abyssicola TaxID=1125966 RepID=A0A8D5UGZ9_9BACL|nr:ectoine hydroxylase [Polycladomyces abyssicola]BCU83075.1 ectoine hydroxylase [Polycladomyces abyssicola]
MSNIKDRVMDLYPSRVNDYPEILKRKDPVIYSKDPAAGPLDAEQINFYQKNGYLLFERFFSEEEVRELRNELKRLWDANQDSDAKEVIREPESREIRSIFAVHRNSETYKQLSQNRRLTDIVKQILGSDVYIHQSRINYKKGFSGKEFYWHSDFETWHVEDGMPRMRALSCSITLEDNYHFNGPLMLIPGSHQYFISCVGKTPENHYQQSLRRQEYGVPDQDSLTLLVKKHGIDSLTGPAGSVVLFDCNLMHGSNSNITPLPRSNVFFVYNSVENKLVEPFSGQAPRPEFIASREQ